MKTNLLKFGVIGVGHLGQHHVRHYCDLDDVDFVGFYDSDKQRAKKIAQRFKTKSFESLEKLLLRVDAVSIVSPTIYHYKIAEKCIIQKKHVFIEKPITSTIEEADRLIKLARERNTVIQVGHIERLNPALVALNKYLLKPAYIEIQRLSPYNIRGTDVPVVLDKMIHDIDIALFLAKSNLENISASGLSILTDSIDIANARIEFKNGCVANITSSRVAKDEIRKIKIFQKNLYATVDLYKRITEVYSINDIDSVKNKSLVNVPFDYRGSKKLIHYDKPTVIIEDALKLELINFSRSIKGFEKPIVDGDEGREALKIAIVIQNKITKKLNK
jgi:predicted dehydrogenase